VERIHADGCLRTPTFQDAPDPRRTVSRYESQAASPRWPKPIEEALQRRLVSAFLHPDDTGCLVIDHNGQISLPATEADLVNTDLAQPVQPIDLSRAFLDDPADDPTDRPPGYARQLRQCRLRNMNRKPRALVFKNRREA
jgi:hypothetical protein